jgi:hypothetical protein
VLVANVGDPGVAEICDRLHDWEGRLVAVTLVDRASQLLEELAAVRARSRGTALGPAGALIGRIAEASPDRTTLELLGIGGAGGPGRSFGAGRPVIARLATAGRHNAANALGVAGAALALGLTRGAILDGLASFEGVGRRLERKGERGRVTVYDDYGHHPTAIRETIAAVRQLEPGRRVWATFEPLTYHRTAAFLADFAAALATADAVAVAEIWAGRDLDTTAVAAGDLAAAVTRLRPEMIVATPGTVDATADWLAAEVRPGDAVLVMGGGRSYRVAERLLERLAENE